MEKDEGGEEKRKKSDEGGHRVSSESLWDECVDNMARYLQSWKRLNNMYDTSRGGMLKLV